MEDLELLMKSFEDAGAMVKKCKPGEKGGVYLNGQEVTKELLEEIFTKGPSGSKFI